MGLSTSVSAVMGWGKNERAEKRRQANGICTRTLNFGAQELDPMMRCSVAKTEGGLHQTAPGHFPACCAGGVCFGAGGLAVPGQACRSANALGCRFRASHAPNRPWCTMRGQRLSICSAIYGLATIILMPNTASIMRSLPEPRPFQYACLRFLQPIPDTPLLKSPACRCF